jgi:hypothetical protein
VSKSIEGLKPSPRGDLAVKDIVPKLMGDRKPQPVLFPDRALLPEDISLGVNIDPGKVLGNGSVGIVFGEQVVKRNDIKAC